MTVAAVPVLGMAERQAILTSLGPRPPREDVEEAKRALASIDAQLNADNKENSSATNRTLGQMIQSKETKESSAAREKAEKQKNVHKALIKLDELHQSYQVVLEHEARTSPLRSTGVDEPSLDDAEANRVVQDTVDNKRENLDLTQHFLKQLPESFSRIVSLVRLDLSFNQLQVLPGSICALVNLESLKVHSNQLQTLPDSLGLLPKLKYLDVSNNALRYLPESVGGCRSLLELNANFNHLEALSTSFGYMLLSLQKLELQLNKLSSIPASLCEVRSLKYLDLHMNKLRELHSSIGYLSELKYLDVSSNFNDLQVLPESIGDLCSLTHLDVSFNQIKELPDTIGRLEKLRTLKLEGNPLVFPPKEVMGQSHDAVMDYLRQQWMTVTNSDLASTMGSPSPGYLSREKPDYLPWIPTCAGNSYLGAWLESWCLTVGTVLSGGKGTFLGFHQYQKDDSFDQQL